MMYASATRRSVLMGAAGLGLDAFCLNPFRSAETIALRVFDSRIARLAGSGIDVANGDHETWQALQCISAQRVVGSLRWSEFVFVRGLLEEGGHRLVSQAMSGGAVSFEFRTRRPEAA